MLHLKKIAKYLFTFLQELLQKKLSLMVITFYLRLKNCLISRNKILFADFPEIKMEDFKEKYDDLINRGYLINFYEEDRDYKITGKYHASCVSIKKNGKAVLNYFSKKSCEEALIVAHELLEIRNGN